MEVQIFQADEKHKISYCRYGIPGGKPAFYFHGLPGSHCEAELLHAACIKHGVELIAVDRFGYGDSTPVKGNRYINWTCYISQLADHIGFEQFYLIATSGGAPYALACASMLKSRVIGTGICCGLGSLALTNLRQPMPFLAKLAIFLAKYAPWLLNVSFGVTASFLSRHYPSSLIKLIGIHNGGADKTILEIPEVKSVMVKTVNRAFMQKYIGGVDDLVAAVQPWPFELKKIHHLQIWHSDNDPVVPMLHSQWLEQQVPYSQLQIVHNEGHFSLPIKYADQIVGQLMK